MFGVASVISKAHTMVSANSKGIALPRIFKQCICQEMLHPGHSFQRLQNLSSWRTCTPKSKTWSYKTDVYSTLGSQQIFKVRPNIFQFFRNSSTNPMNVNTKVANNVLLYKYERPYLYKGAMVFAVSAFAGCLAMADNVYLILVKDLFNSEIKLADRLKRNIFSLTAVTVGIIAGPLMIALVWYITKRSVKYVVLHKGGQIVTFVNYHPVKGEVKMTVPASAITCKAGRNAKKNYLPIKVKNMKHHLIIDRDGQFVNPDLFDSVIGVRRFDS